VCVLALEHFTVAVWMGARELCGKMGDGVR
jgi:hypothetical protein